MGSSFRILVVEDSKPVAEIFSMMLRELGHDVDVAGSGPQAIEYTRSATPDVVFSDISMPGMNGYELAEQLRRERGTEGMFLVAMTGFGQASDRERALASGFDEHLVKPVDVERLQQVLSEAGRRHA